MSEHILTLCNIIIAVSALVTVIIAGKALSTWKQSRSYDLASECISNARIFQIELIVDRMKLSNTPVDKWYEIPPNSMIALQKYQYSSEQARLHFGENITGTILKNLHDFGIEFIKCSGVYFNHKKNLPQIIVDTQIDRSIDIFGKPIPFFVEDNYTESLESSFKNVEKLLKPYINMKKT